jgi:glycosyltransferase involved in cell wall biosynthesis
LNIAGEGEDEYIQNLKALAIQLGIASKINWLGWVSGAAKFELLAQQDLLVLTSYNENFANVVIESLAVGTPVLISNQVGLWDYVQNNHLGWVTTLDVQEIAATIAEAQADHTHREWICANAPGIIQRDFSPLHVAQQYLDAYQEFTQ